MAAPALAALVAVLAGLPGLGLPFLSDDWTHLRAVLAGTPLSTPFGDFRPLVMASFRLEYLMWGPWPVGFRLTNLVLAALAAAALVLLLRRLPGCRRLALPAGLLFAAHPAHVEVAAWFSSRADPLQACLELLAGLAFVRWLSQPQRRWPWAALALGAAALLAKEAALTFPLVFMLLTMVLPRTRSWRTIAVRALAPAVAVVLIHFLALRPWALSGWGRTLLGSSPLTYLKRAAGYAVSAMLPAPQEMLAAHPYLWLAGAVVSLLLLAAAARARPVHGARSWHPVLAAMVAFFLILGPSLVGFQERYLFLPVAASALVLTMLLAAALPAVRHVAAVLLAAGWLLALSVHWAGWLEAGRAARGLEADLITAAREVGVSEIVVANLPLRVAGGSVGCDFSALLAVLGEPEIQVRAAAWVNYAAAADGDGDVRLDDGGAAVRLPSPPGPFTGVISPRPASGGGMASVRIERLAGRAAYLWRAGRLERIF